MTDNSSAFNGSSLGAPEGNHSSTCDAVIEAVSAMVPANSVRLAFRSIGYGPTLLLIMGHRLSGHAWPTRFISALARDFRVVMFDNRGTGESDKPANGYSIRNLANDALGLLDALGIEQAHVLGISMGGAIAQELAYAAPDRVSRLVLCNTWSGVSSCILPSRQALEAARGHWFALPGSEERYWSVNHAPGYVDSNRDAVRAQWERDNEWPTPLSTVALQYEAMRHFEILDRLAEVRSPTLVLAGEADQMVPPANSFIIAGRIPGAQLQLMPGLGHRAPWESPDAVAAIVSRFLQEPSDTRSDTSRRVCDEPSVSSSRSINP